MIVLSNLVVMVFHTSASFCNNHGKNGTINVKWSAEKGVCRLTVCDNGSGISPELLPHVFERGVTDGNGTGLGLVIVKNVVKLHGGEVAIESEAGKGTAVTLMFPIDTAGSVSYGF